MNKLKKTHPFAKFVLTDAIKRSIVFPARTQELEQFYHDLTGLISEIPKHEINVIMGDWNVRLQKRLPHESHVVGPHVFRDEHSKIENLNDDQQRNRTEFIMFCQNHDYVVTNTWFGKPVSKLITYRNPTSHTFEPPYNTNKFVSSLLIKDGGTPFTMLSLLSRKLSHQIIKAQMKRAGGRNRTRPEGRNRTRNVRVPLKYRGSKPNANHAKT